MRTRRFARRSPPLGKGGPIALGQASGDGKWLRAFPWSSFLWRDGERVVAFGHAALQRAASLIDAPYVLLTTTRAAGVAPQLSADAQAVHHVEPGLVDEVAARLRPQVRGELLVALGGGRVIDVAKALAAADPPRRVAAIPTTLSGAEMTAIHRHASGVPAEAAKVRPAIVVSDPSLSASQPEPELVASAANALGHAVEAPLTTRANPVATLAALEAARLVVHGLQEKEPDRDALALGALLAGYAIDAAGYGLHHVLSQTLVRLAGVGHGPANAAMLPHSIEALTRRRPDGIARLATAFGDDPIRVASAIAARAGAARLADLGLMRSTVDRLVEAALARPELELTPPPPDDDELRGLYLAALG